MCPGNATNSAGTRSARRKWLPFIPPLTDTIASRRARSRIDPESGSGDGVPGSLSVSPCRRRTSASGHGLAPWGSFEPRMGTGEAGTCAGHQIRLCDRTIGQSQEQEVPQRSAQRAGREDAGPLWASREGARLSPSGWITMAEQSSRTTAFAHANASENADGLRAPFAAAYVRDAPGRVGGGMRSL